MVQIEDLKGMTFQAEQAGHTFQISGIDDEGNTVALTGTPSGVLLRPDNTDVALTCSVSGGVVSATLPAECYDVPGRFSLTVFVTANGQKTAVYAAIGTVSRTSSGTVSPGTTADVVDLINRINAAINSIPASYSALLADIAPTYSDSALYSVGQYAWYDGDLKRCIVPITTAESYTPAHWTSAVLGQDVSDLKSASYNIEENADVNGADAVSDYRLKLLFEVGGLDYSDGSETTSYTSRRTKFIPYPNHDMYIDDDARVFLYDSGFGYIDNVSMSNSAAHHLLRKQNGVSYIRFMVSSVTAGDIISRTITIKRVTDALFAVPVAEYVNLLDVNHYRVIDGYRFVDDGTLSATSEYLISWYIKVKPGITYYITGGGSTGACNVFYDSNLDIVSVTGQKTITAPAGSAFLRCSILKATASQAMVKTSNDSTFVPYGQEISYDYYYFVPDMAALTSGAALTVIRVSGHKSNIQGYIDNIYVKFNQSGTADIYIIVDNKVIHKFTKTVAAGVNVFKNGVDFTYDNILPANTKIGVGSTNVTIYYGTNGYSSCYDNNLASADIGDTLSLSGGNTYDVSAGFSIKRLAEEALLIDYSNRFDRANRSVRLEKDKYEYYLDEDEINLKFAGGSGLLKIYHTGAPTIENGAMIVIDISNWNLIFAKAISQATMASYQAESTQGIGLTYASGHIYAVKYEHTITGFTVTITDTITRESVSYTNTNWACGDGQGKVGYTADAGITVTGFTSLTKNPFDAKTLIIGDSYTAGYTMWGQKEKRWCSLYAEAIDEKVFMSAMGGQSTNGGLNMLTYLADLCHPEYVIIELGVNDSNLNMYKTNINAMIDFVKNYLHSKPVLVAIPKTIGASSSIYADVDSFVKASGELYIDMITPLTVDGDGTTQNLDLFFADKVHPNVAGHQAIFEQMKIDVPELFVNY